MKNYNKFNILHCVALLLDPRIRSEGLDQTDWGRELKNDAIGRFRFIYRSYSEKFFQDQHADKKRKVDTEDPLGLDAVYFENPKSELDCYLESPRSDRRVDELKWWRDHQSEYPIVSLMARDILCVPATSVRDEKMFSEPAFVRIHGKSSLRDAETRALICIRGWVESSLRKEICNMYI